MAYCTKQDLFDRFGDKEIIRLTDRSHQGVLDETVLDGAIADAGAEIDGYLAGRYRLPLASVPVLLQRIACTMVRFYLHTVAAPEDVRKGYDDAVRTLKGISRGEIALGLDAVGAKQPSLGGVESKSGGKVFGRDNGGIV